MNHEEKDRIVFLTIIAGRKQKDALLSALSEAGVRLTNTIYGKGTVRASYIKNVLGLVPEENKAVITCVMPRTRADVVLKMMVEKFRFDKPNTGVAFTMPIDRVSF